MEGNRKKWGQEATWEFPHAELPELGRAETQGNTTLTVVEDIQQNIQLCASPRNRRENYPLKCQACSTNHLRGEYICNYKLI